MSSLETFIRKPFSGEPHRWLDFKQEVQETLQSSNPLAVKFLFPTVPWVLDGDNLPTINVPELTTYPGLEGTPANFQVAQTVYSNKLKQNEKVQEALMKIRLVLSSRLSTTFQKKLTPITNYYKLYHFWTELEKNQGSSTIAEATKGREKLSILGRAQQPGEFFTTWLNTVEK
jgi:hypothetical protein